MTDKDPRIERRKSLRIYATYVEYSLAEDAASKRIPAFTENISSTGMCILLPEEIKNNSFLFLTIYLFDGGNPIEIKGKVVWTKTSSFLIAKDRNHYDIGIEFVEMDKKNQERLRQYTTRHADEKIDY